MMKATRISGAFAKLCKEQENTLPTENVIVVTHGGVINVIYHIVRGLEWTNKSVKFPASYTSIHKIEYQAGKWEFTLENHVEHI